MEQKFTKCLLICSFLEKVVLLGRNTLLYLTFFNHLSHPNKSYSKYNNLLQSLRTEKLGQGDANMINNRFEEKMNLFFQDFKQVGINFNGFNFGVFHSINSLFFLFLLGKIFELTKNKVLLEGPKVNLFEIIGGSGNDFLYGYILWLFLFLIYFIINSGYENKVVYLKEKLEEEGKKIASKENFINQLSLAMKKNENETSKEKIKKDFDKVGVLIPGIGIIDFFKINFSCLNLVIAFLLLLNITLLSFTK